MLFAKVKAKGMDAARFIIGIGCLVLGFVILFSVPKKLGEGQLAYGSYVMRWTLPFILFIAGVVVIVSAF